MNTVYNRLILRRLTSTFLLAAFCIICLLYFFYFFKKGITFSNGHALSYFYSLCNNNLLSIFSISLIISLQFTIFSLKTRKEFLALKISGYKKWTLSRPFFYFGVFLFSLLFLSLFFLAKPMDSRQELHVDFLPNKLDNRLEVEMLQDSSSTVFFFGENTIRDLFWLRNDGDIWYAKTFDVKTPGIVLGRNFEKYHLDTNGHMKLVESGEILEFPYSIFENRKDLHPRIRSLSTYTILKRLYTDPNTLFAFSENLISTTIYNRISTSFIPFIIILLLLPPLFKYENSPELIWIISVGVFLGVAIIWYVEVATLLGASCLLSPLYSFIVIPSLLTLFSFYRFCKV
jgi:lipopolysaccharide export LptBFGC system permease protein LptF